jgi:O-antigen ligase
MLQTLFTAGCLALWLLVWATGGARLSWQALTATVAWGWLFAALLSAAMGLLQYLGIADASWSAWVAQTPAGTAFANLRQRNQFATLTSIGLLSLLWVVHQSADKVPPGTRALRTAAITAAVVLLASGNAAGSSRTGALQWLLIAVVMVAWFRTSAPAMARWSLVALGVYGAANVLLPLALENLTGISPANALERFNEDSGLQSRRVLWANVWELIRMHPWTGWGWGELKFAHFIYPYTGDRFNAILDNAHNLPLHLAVELGVPAAVLVCGGALALTVWARPWRETSATRQLAWGVLGVIALHSLLEYPLWYGTFQMAALLALGMLCGRRLLRWPLSRWLACAAAGALVVLTAYTGRDYARISQLYIHPSLRSPALQQDTYEKVKNSVLFRDAVQFAYVTTTPLTPQNAQALYNAALQNLHYSPEPRVIEVLLASAALLNLETPFIAHVRERAQVVYGR